MATMLVGLSGDVTLMAVLSLLALLLGIAGGAVVTMYYGAPRKSWRQQREILVSLLLMVVATVCVALLTFAHQRAGVTADWSTFEIEMVDAVVLFVVFMAGLVGTWNLLARRARAERQ